MAWDAFSEAADVWAGFWLESLMREVYHPGRRTWMAHQPLC